MNNYIIFKYVYLTVQWDGSVKVQIYTYLIVINLLTNILVTIQPKAGTDCYDII